MWKWPAGFARASSAAANRKMGATRVIATRVTRATLTSSTDAKVTILIQVCFYKTVSIILSFIDFLVT